MCLGSVRLRSDRLRNHPFADESRSLTWKMSMSYQAPTKDLLFCMTDLAGLDQVAALPGFKEAGADIAQAVLEECARFNEGVIAPLNWGGDEKPSTWKEGVVTTSPGFKDAYRRYAEGGWQGLQHSSDYGGQGLPKTIGAACTEINNSANLSFALCPLLTDGAIEALLTAGSDELKQIYLPRMVSGEWTGTMNLTEPQAGSDLAAVRTRAEPQADSTYRIFGTKIFITYGEHDMADNIVHLVLARVAGAPEGVKGISLFVVPKFIVRPDGSLGDRNDVQCVSIEHKLGIKASPTATMQFGDAGGAIGYRVGEENRGLEYMFIMMNSARYAVGVQGIAIADRAYQLAVAFAKERVQGRPVDRSLPGAGLIINHPDVKRMLLIMRSLVEGCRAMALSAAAAYDTAHAHPDAEVRNRSAALYEFLVPLVKGFSTEMAIEVASLGVQVHGGMGFVEETGAAQHYRDARILTIYEGTTAIQGNDFVGRKTARDGGVTAKALAREIEATEEALRASEHEAAHAMASRLSVARGAFTDVVDFVVARANSDPNAAYAGSVAYLLLAGNLVAGWQLGRAMLVAQRKIAAGEEVVFMRNKIAVARFYAEHLLTRVPGLRNTVIDGADAVNEVPQEVF